MNFCKQEAATAFDAALKQLQCWLEQSIKIDHQQPLSAKAADLVRCQVVGTRPVSDAKELYMLFVKNSQEKRGSNLAYPVNAHIH
jgi:hypothetical protein